MYRTMNLDFEHIDMESFLFAALPVRFQDTEPYDFEQFVAFLFRENGYKLDSRGYNADFGADLIVERGGVHTALRILRYHQVHKVDGSDVARIHSARDYYNCDQGMIITTSSYSAAARAKASDSDIILWDWDRLEKAITDTFLEGLDYYAYFQKYQAPLSSGSKMLSMKLVSVNRDQRSGELEGDGTVTIELTNHSDDHIRVHCDLPIYITHDRKQYSARNWREDSFVNGTIYAGSTVTLQVAFAGRLLTGYKPQDRLVLTLHLMEPGETVLLERKLSEVKQECFLVTYCFGRGSKQYGEMVKFRDEFLLHSKLGTLIVALYYEIGGKLVRILGTNQRIKSVIGPLLQPVIWCCSRLNHKRSRVSD